MSERQQPELGELFQERLAQGDIIGPLKMADGRTSASITVATSLPGQSSTKTEDWAFIVPSGYVRFSGKFEKQHNGGDVAQCDWANGNPADGTVHAHVKASQTNGFARAAASNIYAIKLSAAEQLYKSAQTQDAKSD